MFCSNCGKQLDNLSKFCSDCGYKIEDDELLAGALNDAPLSGAQSMGKSKLEAEIERRKQAALERESINTKHSRYSSGTTGDKINRLRRKASIQGWIILFVLIIILVGGCSFVHIITKGITFEEYKTESKSKLIDNLYTAFGGYGHGLSCKSIYMSYKKAMEDTAPILAEEYISESNGVQDKEQIIQSKLMKLALIEEEGRAKMNYMANEWGWEDIYDYDPWARKLYFCLKEEAMVVYRPYIDDVRSGVANSPEMVSDYNDASFRYYISSVLDEEFGEPNPLKDKIVAKEERDKEEKRIGENAELEENSVGKGEILLDIYTNMPVMLGTSINDVTEIAKLNGLSQSFKDEAYDDGTILRPLDRPEGGVIFNVLYSKDTGEIIYATITTNNSITKNKQKEIAQSLCPVICPNEDVDRVTTWLKENIGKEAKITIGGFTYEVYLGPGDNIVFFAGEAEWSEWYNSVHGY